MKGKANVAATRHGESLEEVRERFRRLARNSRRGEKILCPAREADDKASCSRPDSGATCPARGSEDVDGILQPWVDAC